MAGRDHIKDSLLGVAVGDALGVPVEFQGRSILKQRPVQGMIAGGAHGQLPGTWSDDSSLTFCLAEMLCGDYDLRDLANRFVNWKNQAYWTPRGDVFDIGIGTSYAIDQLQSVIDPVMAGGTGVGDNGNGSLMRILPLLFHIKDMNPRERFGKVREVSSLTHGHIRSIIACYIYLEFARIAIRQEVDPITAYKEVCISVPEFFKSIPQFIPDEELAVFDRVLSGQLIDLEESQIFSSGYVLHTLEAAIWCILRTDNYDAAVLLAVNLGEDTDTTGAVAGGLAGLFYGWETINSSWINELAKRQDIEDLIIRLNRKFNR